MVGPTHGIFAHAPHHCLDRFGVLAQRRPHGFWLRAHFFAPHLVHGGVGQRDDMKAVIADLGLRQTFGYAFGIGRAHGTSACVVLPQALQSTRGTSACSHASNWKKSKCRQLRLMRSWTPCPSTPQAGHDNLLASHFTSKSIRRLTVFRSTLDTTHGACKPSAVVNRASTAILIRELWTQKRGYPTWYPKSISTGNGIEPGHSH